MSKTTLNSRGRNPDVLTCIANLSSDEVFTPPEFANQMLDTLEQAWASANDGASIWSDSRVTFLDPFTKSGVFLREIAKRLIDGLEADFPELTVRVNHIMANQLYGIGITELTGLIARRSLYCSKYADGPYSVSDVLDDERGNIWFERTEHTWKTGRCEYCGAKESELLRGSDLETHAYAFIHTDNINARLADIFGDQMKFDVIIGNPPYQLNDGGAQNSAMPIYHKFVEQAIALEPRYVNMVIPARWFAGGRGLDAFRDTMLHDDRITTLHDFPSAADVFPGVEVKGGVCYFLWERDSHGLCSIYSHAQDVVEESTRPLVEPGMDTFVRNTHHLKLLEKIRLVDGSDFEPFSQIVSANDPFGFDVREEGSFTRVRAPYKLAPFKGSVDFYYNGWRKEGLGHVEKRYIARGHDLVDGHKLFVARVWGSGIASNDRVTPFIAGPNSCSTETYLAIGPFETDDICRNVQTYMNTRFFHCMVAVMKSTQQAMKKVYSCVPMQDFSVGWTDRMLYERYNLNSEDISFIERTTRPIEDGGE